MQGIGIGAGGVALGLIDESGRDDKNVVICCPTISEPHPATLKAIEDSIPLVEEAGWTHTIVFEIGCPYISAARSKMIRKALNYLAPKDGCLVFIDHDVSWAPGDLLKLIETPDYVVAGTYRFKKEEEEYMGLLLDDAETHRPIVRADGCIKAELIPAGFLKVTTKAIDKFMKKHPHLSYGPAYGPSVDLFNHGAEGNRWYSEDYAFSRHWLETG